MSSKQKFKTGFRKIKFKIKPKKIFKTLFKLFVLGLVLTVILFVWYSKDLPSLANIEKRINVGSTQILDRDGNLLYALSQDKKRLVVPLKDIPKSAIDATIAIEDKNFYHHFGIDFRGLIRGVVLKPLTGHRAEGGSTLTQQFVKNALLSSRRTVSRKIKEAILSLELEAIYPKDKILELYLNEIPYGSTAYGIDAASRQYFGKPAKDLTLPEAAALAALPQAPTYYSPYGNNKDKLLKRKDLVLDRMAKFKMISREEAEKAKAEKIHFIPRKDSIKAPHFVFYVQQLVADKYGEDVLQTGGLKITTTLDSKAQKLAQEAVDRGTAKLKRYRADNAALVALDPKTGEILAMVGSRDYFNQDIQGQVNVAVSKRQPGSSFKPIVYATAFKGKYNPAYPLFDLKTTFGNYTPTNYDGKEHGPVTMRIALANSLNIPAVKTLALVGVKEALATAKDLGINSLNQPERYGLSLVLGGGEVEPLEMAGAFGAFANEGRFNKPVAILKIEDSEGRILEEYRTPPNKKALDPQVAFLINDILSDNGSRSMTFGTRNYLTLPGRRVAAKTGTTSEFRDAWTVGYTPQVSTAVWVGNTDNAKMRGGAAGSVVAAPIWNDFMKNYLKGKKAVEFEKPEGIKGEKVDFLSNKLPTEQSPPGDTIYDIFASWNYPTEKDDIHQKLKVNKINGKLATDLTPPELVEERLYTAVHSAMPDNPQWEDPVKSWAESRNMYNQPPAEKDDMYSLATLPAVEITAPAQNSVVRNNRLEVSLKAVAHYGVAKVAVSIDGQEKATLESSPYSASIDVSDLSQGDHTLTASIEDKNGVVKNSSNVLFKLDSDVTPPKVGIINVKSSASSASVSFTTDEPAEVQIEYGLTAALGKKTVKSTQFGVSHNIAINGLSPKQLYYYRVVAQDASGNTIRTTVSTFSTK